MHFFNSYVLLTFAPMLHVALPFPSVGFFSLGQTSLGAFLFLWISHLGRHTEEENFTSAASVHKSVAFNPWSFPAIPRAGASSGNMQPLADQRPYSIWLSTGALYLTMPLCFNLRSFRVTIANVAGFDLELLRQVLHY